MKPEKGLDEMEEKEYEPREIFAEMGLLIMEARSPDLSAKGRVEGPHCPPVKGTREHTCDRHKEQCRKARDLLDFQEILWQNKIPMRIDVLLFPSCEHGLREETIVEGASFSCMDSFELLERWDIQMVNKRSPEKMEGFVSGRVHLQAVRSYLHFSQLSSWLISAGGAVPFRVVYRIYAPGEAVGYTFTSLPNVHNFPSAELSNVVMRSTVAHLPRQEQFISLSCRSLSPTIEQHLRSRKIAAEEKTYQSVPLVDPYTDPIPSTSKCDITYHHINKQKQNFYSNAEMMDCGKTNQQQLTQKPPIGRKSKDEDHLKSRSGPCPVSRTPKRKVDQLSPTMKHAYEFPSVNQSENSNFDTNTNQNTSQDASKTEFSAEVSMRVDSIKSKPSILYDKSSFGDGIELKTPEKYTSAKVHPYKKPNSLMVSTNNAFIGSKRLPSPKVLVTGSKKPEPTDFKKRCLDLNSGEILQEPVDNFTGLKPLAEITSDDLQDLIKPLSPSDLEAYLSSLSNKASRRIGTSKLDEIPMTKCSFYLEEHDGFKEAKEKEQKNNYESKDAVINSKSLSPVKTQCLSCNTERKSPLSSKKSDGENHVRKLFCRSVSSPDIETNFVLFDNVSDGTNKHGVSKNSDNIHGDNQHLCEYVAHDGKPKSDETHCEAQSDLHTPKSLSRETTPKVTDCSRGATPGCSRGATPGCSTRDLTLKTLSIPCKIGGNNSAISTLVQTLESMEIEETNLTSNLSSSADIEVENHMKTENEMTNGYSQMGPGVADESPNNCDTSPNRDLSLCKQLLKKEFQQNVKNEMLTHSSSVYKSLPSPDDIRQFQFVMGRSASAIFNATTGLPSRSSPAPIKKRHSKRFDYDCTLTNVRAIKNAISCSKLTLQSEDSCDTIEDPKILSTSAPASTNCLLGNFEESVLNGRIEPVGVVEGFSVEIGAGGTFCPKHVTLPVIAYFFQLSDDNAPSPYLGYVNLEPLGKRGYHIPRTGTVQVTLFNPNKSVVKMFVVMYDLSDMPANCQTFLRQRTMYTPVDVNSTDPSYLRYLIHLRFQSSKSGKIYLHTDIRLIFARDKFEFDPQVANYELRSFTEGPENPKFSPKR